jgi:hypothetical protein
MLARLVQVIGVALLAMTLTAGGSPVASEGIGKAEKVVLDVRSLMPRGERRLVVNSDVFKDEVVETKDRSATRLVFRDETYLSMGPNSKVRIADLPVARDIDRPFVVEATSGVFKFVSGRLRSDQYRIETPSATIGVRGTIVWISVSGSRLTQVASQTGEVFVCAKENCVTLVGGEATKVEGDRPPTPPAPVPDDFYALIRDMTARLMIDGSDGITAAIDAAEFKGLFDTAKSSRGTRSRRVSASGPGTLSFSDGGFRRFRALPPSPSIPTVPSVPLTSSAESGNGNSDVEEDGQPPTDPDAAVAEPLPETGDGRDNEVDIPVPVAGVGPSPAEEPLPQTGNGPDNEENPLEPVTGVWPDKAAQPVAIPAPATALLLLFGLCVLGGFRWFATRAWTAPVSLRGKVMQDGR